MCPFVCPMGSCLLQSANGVHLLVLQWVAFKIPGMDRSGGFEDLEVIDPHDHHAFHEDAKPGDLSLQFPIRWRSSSNQLVTM